MSYKKNHDTVFSKYGKQFNAAFFWKKVSAKKRIQTLAKVVERKPLTSFYISLAVLFFLLLLGSILSNLGSAPEEKKVLVKNVSVYHIGKAPSITLQGKIEKTGIVKLIAQTAGVVQTIHVAQGDNVAKGTSIISLSTNYQGGDAMSLQRQLAQTQYTNVIETFDTQKDIIKKSREITEKSNTNTIELRDISGKSLDETRSLITTNENLLTSINTNLTNMEADNVSGKNDATILQVKQAQAGVQAGLNQLRSGLRNLEYSTNSDKSPTQLANLQKDITLKQLDLQEKALEMSKEISRLQLNLAYVSESVMHPASPYKAIVEKIMVNEGQYVTPGTLLAILACPQPNINVTALAPREIAQAISLAEVSQITIGKNKIAVTPSYISQNATDGQLYSIQYQIANDSKDQVTDNEFISITVPLTYDETEKETPYIPIDAVYQSQNETYVFVVQNGQAATKKITLGNVYGKYAELISGLEKGDLIIMDRTIVAGEQVKVL